MRLFGRSKRIDEEQGTGRKYDALPTAALVTKLIINYRFVCYDFATKALDAITLAVMGLFGRPKRHTTGNFEEKKDFTGNILAGLPYHSGFQV